MAEPTIADLPCRYCDGEGRDPRLVDPKTLVIEQYKDRACQLCDGRGIVRLQFLDTPTNCRLCEGTGRKAGGPAYGTHVCSPCAHCRGIGYLTISGMITVGGPS